MDAFLNFTTSFAPVPCRNDLAVLAERHFRGTGNAAEIGVYRGDFAHKNLQEWKGRYWVIDAWQFRDDGSQDKNFPDEASNRQNYEATKNNIAFAADRVSSSAARFC